MTLSLVIPRASEGRTGGPKPLFNDGPLSLGHPVKPGDDDVGDMA
jgi:hypothetical protein